MSNRPTVSFSTKPGDSFDRQFRQSANYDLRPKFDRQKQTYRAFRSQGICELGLSFLISGCELCLYKFERIEKLQCPRIEITSTIS